MNAKPLPPLDPAAPLNLRPATVADIPAIRALIGYWAERGRMLERSEELLRATIHEFLLLETPEGLAGCVGVHRLADDLAEVRGLAVRHEFRGRGLGRWLVLGAERQARDLGLRRLFAWTYEVRFFERCGYARIPRDAASLPVEIHAECNRCPFLTDCREIAVIKFIPQGGPVLA
ncbi:MAG TPA: N-acetyltransferase [Deinococcales bacterium]|nr:N-acetyltransferase [Deinococcales bacterium]